MHFPLIKTLFRAASALFLVSVLTACGGSGSSGNSDYTYAYLHFYNGSPNGATVYFRELDGDDLGAAQFGDSSSLLALDSGELELEFYRLDSDDQEVVIDELTVQLKKSYKTVVIMRGDFESPTFESYQFKRETLDEHFRLMATSVLLDETQSFDLYMSDAGDPFEAANYLGTIEAGELTEYTYWDGDSDSEDFNEDEYTIYLTNPGETDVVFETPTINFAYNTEYVLLMRDISGAIQNGMAMDVLLNSSTVSEVTDVDALSQYRIYNSLDSDSPITVTFTGDDEGEAITLTLAAGEVSDFTEINYGDYRISASIGDTSLTAFNNKLITLNQSESKAIVIYEKAGALASLSFVESSLSQAYDKTINFVNLVEDYDDVDFYLVRHDETIDTAEYSVQNVEFTESDTDVVPADYYEIIAVHEDNNDEQYLLYRLPLTGFNEDTNYIITVEPSDNASGYEIVVVD